MGNEASVLHQPDDGERRERKPRKREPNHRSINPKKKKTKELRYVFGEDFDESLLEELSWPSSTFSSSSDDEGPPTTPKQRFKKNGKPRKKPKRVVIPIARPKRRDDPAYCDYSSSSASSTDSGNYNDNNNGSAFDSSSSEFGSEDVSSVGSSDNEEEMQLLKEAAKVVVPPPPPLGTISIQRSNNTRRRQRRRVAESVKGKSTTSKRGTTAVKEEPKKTMQRNKRPVSSSFHRRRRRRAIIITTPRSSLEKACQPAAAVSRRKYSKDVNSVLIQASSTNDEPPRRSRRVAHWERRKEETNTTTSEDDDSSDWETEPDVKKGTLSSSNRYPLRNRIRNNNNKKLISDSSSEATNTADEEESIDPISTLLDTDDDEEEDVKGKPSNDKSKKAIMDSTFLSTSKRKMQTRNSISTGHVDDKEKSVPASRSDKNRRPLTQRKVTTMSNKKKIPPTGSKPPLTTEPPAIKEVAACREGRAVDSDKNDSVLIQKSVNVRTTLLLGSDNRREGPNLNSSLVGSNENEVEKETHPKTPIKVGTNTRPSSSIHQLIVTPESQVSQGRATTSTATDTVRRQSPRARRNLTSVDEGHERNRGKKEEVLPEVENHGMDDNDNDNDNDNDDHSEASAKEGEQQGQPRAISFTPVESQLLQEQQGRVTNSRKSLTKVPLRARKSLPTSRRKERDKNGREKNCVANEVYKNDGIIITKEQESLVNGNVEEEKRAITVRNQSARKQACDPKRDCSSVKTTISSDEVVPQGRKHKDLEGCPSVLVVDGFHQIKQVSPTRTRRRRELSTEISSLLLVTGFVSPAKPNSPRRTMKTRATSVASESKNKNKKKERKRDTTTSSKVPKVKGRKVVASRAGRQAVKHKYTNSKMDIDGRPMMKRPRKRPGLLKKPVMRKREVARERKKNHSADVPSKRRPRNTINRTQGLRLGTPMVETPITCDNNKGNQRELRATETTGEQRVYGTECNGEQKRKFSTKKQTLPNTVDHVDQKVEFTKEEDARKQESTMTKKHMNPAPAYEFGTSKVSAKQGDSTEAVATDARRNVEAREENSSVAENDVFDDGDPLFFAGGEGWEDEERSNSVSSVHASKLTSHDAQQTRREPQIIEASRYRKPDEMLPSSLYYKKWKIHSPSRKKAKLRSDSGDFVRKRNSRKSTRRSLRLSRAGTEKEFSKTEPTLVKESVSVGDATHEQRLLAGKQEMKFTLSDEERAELFEDLQSAVQNASKLCYVPLFQWNVQSQETTLAPRGASTAPSKRKAKRRKKLSDSFGDLTSALVLATQDDGASLVPPSWERQRKQRKSVPERHELMEPPRNQSEMNGGSHISMASAGMNGTESNHTATVITPEKILGDPWMPRKTPRRQRRTYGRSGRALMHGTKQGSTHASRNIGVMLGKESASSLRSKTTLLGKVSVGQLHDASLLRCLGGEDFANADLPAFLRGDSSASHDQPGKIDDASAVTTEALTSHDRSKRTTMGSSIQKRTPKRQVLGDVRSTLSPQDQHATLPPFLTTKRKGTTLSRRNAIIDDDTKSDVAAVLLMDDKNAKEEPVENAEPKGIERPQRSWLSNSGKGAREQRRKRKLHQRTTQDQRSGKLSSTGSYRMIKVSATFSQRRGRPPYPAIALLQANKRVGSGDEPHSPTNKGIPQSLYGRASVNTRFPPLSPQGQPTVRAQNAALARESILALQDDHQHAATKRGPRSTTKIPKSDRKEKNRFRLVEKPSEPVLERLSGPWIGHLQEGSSGFESSEDSESELSSRSGELAVRIRELPIDASLKLPSYKTRPQSNAAIGLDVSTDSGIQRKKSKQEESSVRVSANQGPSKVRASVLACLLSTDACHRGGNKQPRALLVGRRRPYKCRKCGLLKKGHYCKKN